MNAEEKKLFVLDTNVLMHDPGCLYRFQEHDIFLPMVVLEELDRNKRGQTIEELQQSIAGIDSPEEVSDHEEEIKVDVGAN